MDLNEYQQLAMRTSVEHDNFRERMTNAIFGLCGEVGELADGWKKVLFQNHNIYGSDMLEEIGDILWYVAQASNAVGFTLEQVAQANIEKLKKRYPEGFSSERSINRNG